jgi:allantoinase
MPAERRYGMDHAHYDWSPMPTRGRLRWPEQARVALCVLISLDHMEWQPPAGSFQSPFLAGGLGPRGYPDYPRLTHRDYGHRVGIFRVFEVLEKYGIPPTVAMDALTAEHYPELVRHCQRRGCEIIAHGLSASRMITSRMTEQEEREYIHTSIETLARATGTAPAGWFGPEYGESARTPQLLAQAGIRYVCDWTNDEQPYRMKTAQGELFALPLMLELDDVHALWDRRVPIDRYEQLLRESFNTLYRDGAQNGRLLVLHLHPWLIGQPFRIGFLDAALGAMMQCQGVWAAQGSTIIDWFRQHGGQL